MPGEPYSEGPQQNHIFLIAVQLRQVAPRSATLGYGVFLISLNQFYRYMVSYGVRGEIYTRHYNVLDYSTKGLQALYLDIAPCITD